MKTINAFLIVQLLMGADFTTTLLEDMASSHRSPLQTLAVSIVAETKGELVIFLEMPENLYLFEASVLRKREPPILSLKILAETVRQERDDSLIDEWNKKVTLSSIESLITELEKIDTKEVQKIHEQALRNNDQFNSELIFLPELSPIEKNCLEKRLTLAESRSCITIAFEHKETVLNQIVSK